jgi:arylsulfatase A-like enzyme
MPPPDDSQCARLCRRTPGEPGGGPANPEGTGIAAPNASALIKPGTATIASLLRQQGYATAVVGKWHLGLGEVLPDGNGDLKPGPNQPVRFC